MCNDTLCLQISNYAHCIQIIIRPFNLDVFLTEHYMRGTFLVDIDNWEVLFASFFRSITSYNVKGAPITTS